MSHSKMTGSATRTNQTEVEMNEVEMYVVASPEELGSEIVAVFSDELVATTFAAEFADNGGGKVFVYRADVLLSVNPTPSDAESDSRRVVWPEEED